MQEATDEPFFKDKAVLYLTGALVEAKEMS
jgi:hypothetical protein